MVGLIDLEDVAEDVDKGAEDKEAAEDGKRHCSIREDREVTQQATLA